MNKYLTANRQAFTQAQFEETLPRDVYDKAQIYAAMVHHRRACVRLIRDTVLEMLADPAMTRGKLRRELAEVCAWVEQHGC